MGFRLRTWCFISGLAMPWLSWNMPINGVIVGQRILVVVVEDYACLVAFVESDEEKFLNTIITGRKATKQYMGDSDG